VQKIRSYCRGIETLRQQTPGSFQTPGEAQRALGHGMDLLVPHTHFRPLGHPEASIISSQASSSTNPPCLSQPAPTPPPQPPALSMWGQKAWASCPLLVPPVASLQITLTGVGQPPRVEQLLLEQRSRPLSSTPKEVVPSHSHNKML
jgi:hypothetical protein